MIRHGKASIFNRYGKLVAGAGLLAVINVTRIFADGMPEENRPGPPDGDQNSAHSVLLDVQKDIKDIKEKIGSLTSSQEKTPEPVNCKVEEPKLPEITTQLGHLEKNVDELVAKANDNKVLGMRLPWGSHDDFSDVINILNIVAIFAAGFEIWQAHKNNWQQREAVRKNQAASFLAKQNLEEQKGIIRGNRTRAMLGDIKPRRMERIGDLIRAKSRGAPASDSNSNRSERIGDFPELYYYIADRIQNTQGTVIITMPFYLFGVLRSPHGVHNFHHTLNELFNSATGGDNKRRLVIITYDNNSRHAKAGERYSKAIHAMDTLDDMAQSQMLKRIFTKDIWEPFSDKLQKFWKLLDKYKRSREILTNLAKEQEEFLKGKGDVSAEIMDKEFLKHLKKLPASLKNFLNPMYSNPLNPVYWRHRYVKIKLFRGLHNIREAFGHAVGDQEQKYFDPARQEVTGTPWPSDATIIRVQREKLEKICNIFDNEMTVFAGGELMRAYSSLAPADNTRRNKLMSESGQIRIKRYKKDLAGLFEIAGREQFPDEILEQLNQDLPGIEMVEEWLKTPRPRV